MIGEDDPKSSIIKVYQVPNNKLLVSQMSDNEWRYTMLTYQINDNYNETAREIRHSYCSADEERLKLEENERLHTLALDRLRLDYLQCTGFFAMS
jgi:hypothetical protein